MDTADRTPWAQGLQGAAGDEEGAVPQTLAADEPTLPPALPLGNAPGTDGGDSVLPGKAVFSTQERETPRVEHSAAATVWVKGFVEKPRGKANQGSPEEAKRASADRPLCCLC